jgi:ATP-binding cassette, subfamily B, multidrug efflux pump
MLAPALSVAREPAYASFKSGHVAGITEMTDPHIPERSHCGALGVALRNVTFTYPGATRPALIDFSLEIAPGSLVAVTGAVGSGKSALARALLGVYPVASGTVRLATAAGAALDHPVGLAGYLPQDAHLFSGTVRDNVLMVGMVDRVGTASEAYPEFAARAVQIASLATDVAEFPAGMDTPIGELGVRVSGGQRQRLGLARAIAAYAPHTPGLLVLDDPFSAVDVETETRIVAALREAFGPHQPAHQRATILLCSQRLAAFPQADRVLVLENGRIAEQGTHHELMLREGLYARIYRAQVHSASSEPALSKDES